MAAISLAAAAAFSSSLPGRGAVKLPSLPKCHSSSSSTSLPRLRLHSTHYMGLARSGRHSSCLTSSFAARAAAPAGLASPGCEEAEKVQEMFVYEINEGDRESPVYLRMSPKQVQNALGDVVFFTNKIYTGDLQTRIGVTSGLLHVVHHDEAKNGDRYEAMYSFYFGDYGHISVQGPYLTHDDTTMAITGGTGMFEGVGGSVRLHNVLYPLKLFYTFRLKGIPDLPKELLGGEVVPPAPEVEASAAAMACEATAVIKGYTH